MKWQVRSSQPAGAVRVPGDKSVAHRALMLAGLASGTSSIGNLPHGEDVLSTARCMRALGVDVQIDAHTAVVHSSGTLVAPNEDLDAGNSGTTTRLLSGILAGHAFPSRVTGDESLRRRPMGRVADPLRSMGAEVRLTDGHAPIDIRGGALQAIRYRLPVASAQIKSAILLAGLFATGTTEVVEPEPTRDHTERMFAALGIPVRRAGNSVFLDGGARPGTITTVLPGDISTAAFFFAAAALGGAGITVCEVGVNPTRTGLLRALERMGASVTLANQGVRLGEPIADVTVRGPIRHPLTVDGPEVPALIDELPLLALLSTQVDGESTVRGAAELRVKETDRITTVAGALNALGARVEERADGFVIHGGTPLHGGPVRSAGDHRLAMMLAVAGTVADGVTVIDGAEAAAVSFPTFAETFAGLGAEVTSE